MEETLNTIYDELVDSLSKPFIFYIPRKFWVEIDGKKWNDKKFDEVFDTVVLIKADGSNNKLINKPSNYYIIGKTAQLDKNTYKLFDKKAELDTDSFKFLVKKYSQQLAFYRRITTWMFDNVRDDVSDVNIETLKSFELQKIAFENHWHYIQEHFIKTERLKDIGIDSNLTSQDFKSINDLMGKSFQSGKELIKKTKTIKKDKKILITEDEAEKFLLKNVFNVDL